MQMALDFGAGAEIALMRDQLRAFFGCGYEIQWREPVGQLVKSLISSRTRDEISLRAYERLTQVYPRWSDLAAATVDTVQTLIDDVTFPDVKARHLIETLRAIEACHPDFDLSFLGRWPVADSLAWLERLPGVGRKVSASTLNFSTLQMPAFVVDTHVLRVFRRFGLVGAKAETKTAYDAVMATTAGWTAAEIAEFHIIVKRLGQTLCRADQACCQQCPLGRRCKATDESNGRVGPDCRHPPSGRLFGFDACGSHG